MPTLLVAGSLDGGGKVGEGMANLQRDWTEKGGNVDFKLIDGAGHLPMVDKTEEWWTIVGDFLRRL